MKLAAVTGVYSSVTCGFGFADGRVSCAWHHKGAKREAGADWSKAGRKLFQLLFQLLQSWRKAVTAAETVKQAIAQDAHHYKTGRDLREDAAGNQQGRVVGHSTNAILYRSRGARCG